MPFSFTVIQKCGDEEALPGDHPFKPFKEATSCGCLHFNTLIHEHHGPCLCPYAFTGIQFNFNDLHVISVDLVIDYIRHFLASLCCSKKALFSNRIELRCFVSELLMKAS